VKCGWNLVGGRGTITSNDNFTNVPSREKPPGVVHYCHLRSRCDTNRPGLALWRGQGIARHLDSCLRHAVGSPLHFRHQLGRQRGGTGSYEEQPRWLRNATSNGDPVKDGLVYGWDRSEPSGLELFHPIQNLRNVKAGCAHHAGSMHMEKRHDVQATVHLGEFQRTDDILSGEN